MVSSLTLPLALMGEGWRGLVNSGVCSTTSFVPYSLRYLAEGHVFRSCATKNRNPRTPSLCVQKEHKTGDAN